jgi:hypothetical protein
MLPDDYEVEVVGGLEGGNLGKDRFEGARIALQIFQLAI